FADGRTGSLHRRRRPRGTRAATLIELPSRTACAHISKALERTQRPGSASEPAATERRFAQRRSGANKRRLLRLLSLLADPALRGAVAGCGGVGLAHIGALLGRAVAAGAGVVIDVRLGVDPDDLVGGAAGLGLGFGGELASACRAGSGR